MPELLVEILSEEIPANIQAKAADNFKHLISEEFKGLGLGFSSAEALVTPRRLVVVVYGLARQTIN